jgi:hypothetical protein
MVKAKGLCKGICLVVVMASGVVDASPLLNSAGAKCVPENVASVNVTSEGEVQNLEPGIVTVVCPAERSISPTDTTFSGTVFAIDLNQSQNVCCRAVSRNTSGNKVTSPFACTSGFGSSFQGLTTASITDTLTFSQFYLECQIPAATADGDSGILGYRAIAQ